MDISSLRFAEVVSIVATYQVFSQKDEPDFVGRYTPEQIEVMRKAQKKSSANVRSLNFKFTKPVKEFPCGNFEYLTTLFLPFSKHGVLPYPGTLSEQPNKIIEAFNVLKALIGESEEKLRKELEKKSKGKPNG